MHLTTAYSSLLDEKVCFFLEITWMDSACALALWLFEWAIRFVALALYPITRIVECQTAVYGNRKRVVLVQVADL